MNFTNCLDIFSRRLATLIPTITTIWYIFVLMQYRRKTGHQAYCVVSLEICSFKSKTVLNQATFVIILIDILYYRVLDTSDSSWNYTQTLLNTSTAI
jgi:hypothetical protein